MKLKDISETFEADLQDLDFIVGYLELALNDGLPTFLVALREVVQANGGVNKVAQNTNLGRESLYKALSESGNPQFETINKILGSLGLKLSINIGKNDSNINSLTMP
jgi:probable addiction module antidote protein